MKRFVAFLDILGFKHIVKDREHAELIEIMHTFKSAIKLANSIPIIADCQKDSLVNCVTFSDSIVLYTDGIESHDFYRLVHVVKILIGCSLGSKTPLRGSISHGDFYADKENEIYVGDALVSAYENEGNQQWSGAYICDFTAELILSAYPDVVESLKKFAYLIDYDIPFKQIVGKDVHKRLAINWANSPIALPMSLEKCVRTGYSFLSAQFDAACDSIEQDNALKPEDKANLLIHVDTQAIPQDIHEKWMNTLEFYNTAKENGHCPIVYGQQKDFS